MGRFGTALRSIHLTGLDELNEAWFEEAANDGRVGRDKSEVDDVVGTPWYSGEKLKIN